MTIRDVTIKNPDRKWGGDVNDVMPGSAEDLGDLKKKQFVEIQTWARPDDLVRYGHRTLVRWVEGWDLNSEQERRFLVWPRRDQLGSMKCAARLLKKLCLSLLMSKYLKLKKVIKSFVPEPISCFLIPICVWTLWTFYACEYLGRICGPITCYISTRPSDRRQKKENLLNYGLCRPERPQSENNRKRKER